MEIGPFRLSNDHTLRQLNSSWNEFANVLFVDQPLGTGFSYANTDSLDHEMAEVADHMVTFLEKWFAIFPQYEADDVGHTSLPFLSMWSFLVSGLNFSWSLALYRWRVVRRSAYSIHRQSNH